MEINIPELAESATVLAIAIVSVMVAVIRYARTQFEDSTSSTDSDTRKLVLAIREHGDETVRALTKINLSLEQIKKAIEENRNDKKTI